MEGFLSSGTEWHWEIERVDAVSGDVQRLLRLPDQPPYDEPGNIQQGRDVWTVLAGAVVGMWTDHPSIMVYGGDGAPVRKIRLPLTRLRITDRDIQDQIELYGEMASGMRPGPTSMTNELYAVNDTVFGMFTSQLRRAAENPILPHGRRWWRLLSVRGEYLGVLALPDDYLSFKGSFLGREHDLGASVGRGGLSGTPGAIGRARGSVRDPVVLTV